MLLRRVRESGERDFQVSWRYFSLAQVNHRDGAGWTAWGASEPVKGIAAFRAAEAARRQGPEAFLRMHDQILDAVHDRKLSADDPEMLDAAASAAGLDLARLRADLVDPSILDSLARDHTEAVTRHHVFGTPTFVFADGRAAYVRIRPAPEGAQAVELFDELVGTIARRPYLLELKRPAAPD